MSGHTEFEAERSSKTDELLLAHVVEPLWRHIPSHVTPNTITLITPFLAVTAFVLAAAAPHLSPVAGMWARIFAGVMMFGTMLTDHLDGMQARRTGQASRLGEVLDHWLDAIHVPLATAGMVLTLGVGSVEVAVCVLTTGMIYNAQLVLYHHTGRFVCPPSGGMTAMVLLATAYAVVGVLLFLFPLSLPGTQTATTVFAWAIIMGQCRNALFYYPKLGAWMVHHLKFVVVSCAFIALHFMGAYGILMTAALLVLTSFRLSGTYVLRTVLKTPYNGFDWTLLLAAVGIGVWHLMPRTGALGFVGTDLLAGAVGLYIVVRNVGDLSVQMPVLKPAPVER